MFPLCWGKKHFNKVDQLFQREKIVDLIICTECIFDDLNTELLFETLHYLAQKNPNIKVLIAQGLHNECGRTFQTRIQAFWNIEILEKTYLDPEFVHESQILLLLTYKA